MKLVTKENAYFIMGENALELHAWHHNQLIKSRLDENGKSNTTAYLKIKF